MTTRLATALNSGRPTKSDRDQIGDRRRWQSLSIGLVIVALTVSACGTATLTPAPGSPGASTSTSAAASTPANATSAPVGGEKLIIVIAHTSFGTSGGFWATIKSGAEAAGRDFAGYGIKVDFAALDKEDPSQMGQLIDAAVARNPAGLIISLPSPDAEKGAIQAAIAKGIPVFTYNSGIDNFKDVGSLLHVGSDEYDSGYQAGVHFYDAGARNVLCDNAVPENIATATRCQALNDAMVKLGGKSEQIVGDLNDPSTEKNIIETKLQADPSYDAVIGIGVPFTVSSCVQIQAEKGLQGKLHCATFDTFQEALDGIQAGTVDYAIGQQPYLQGYIPVSTMALYLATGNLPGGAASVIPTGPFFVDKTNIDVVLKSVSSGARP
jgi:simple sugar transport system substrate-binding protein